MKVHKQIYVKFSYIYCHGYGRNPVSSEAEALNKAFAEPSTYGFQLSTQTFAEVDGETLSGQVKYGTVGYFGEVFTLDELKANGADAAFIARMKREGDLFAVKTRYKGACGGWYAVKKGEKVYSADDCRLVLEISLNGKPKRLPASAPSIK